MWDAKLTGDWKKLEALLKNATPAVEREVKRATKFNALMLQRAVRENIQSGNQVANSRFTILLKKSRKPLVDSGELFKAISNIVTSPYHAEVGVLKTSGNANYAVAVHEGALIPVTAKMRAMFHALADYSDGRMDLGELGARAQEIAKRIKPGAGRFHALSPSTAFIRVPGRPFLREVFEDEVIQRKALDNWLNAVAYAIAGRPSPPMGKE